MTSPTSITDALAALSMDEEGCSLLEELLSSSTKVLVCTTSFLDKRLASHRDGYSLEYFKFKRDS